MIVTARQSLPDAVLTNIHDVTAVDAGSQFHSKTGKKLLFIPAGKIMPVYPGKPLYNKCMAMP
jgi:hypothetical protein